MMTLRQFAAEPATIPMNTSWYLADLSEARGKQELYTRQAPQKLQALREHALVESAISSNRIEGIEVDKSRVATLIFGHSSLHDRDEEEVRGYRYALKLIHEDGAKLPISETNIKELHRLSRGEIWDAGAYKEKDVDIIQTYPDGRSRVRFKSVSAGETPPAMAEMIELWQRGLRERWVHPLILAAALNLDFLCIHPFRDGNGRVSRLKSPRGEKTATVLAAIARQIGAFRVADLQSECPGVSVDLIRKLLGRLQKEKQVTSLGTGRSAQWQKTGN